MEKGKETYKLPEGWIEVKLEDISKQITDGSHNPPKAVDSGIPMLSARNIENDNITFDDVRFIADEEFERENYRTKIETGDVLLTIVATIGRTAVVSDNSIAFTLQRSVAAIKPLIHSKYLMYSFQSPFFQKQLTDNAKGTAQKGVYLRTLRSLKIPLAPLQEQERIVSKIESLFSELDQAGKGLQKAKQQLEIYMQALLKSAFEGKLTNKNVEFGKLPEDWNIVKVSDISNVVRGGSPRPAGDTRYYGGSIPFLKVKDITKDNKVVLNTYEYTIKEAGLKKTRRINPKTLLLSNSGATLGVPKICMIDATINDGIAAFLNLDERSVSYLYYYFLSKTQQLRNINMGAAQPNLNTSIINNIEVAYCSFDEQNQIVEILESRFTLIDNLDNSINKSLNDVMLFKHSILKNAFEGKLVSQNSNDESAELLLRKIKQEKSDYLKAQKELDKLKPKKKRQMEKRQKILEIFESSDKPIASKELWQRSIHHDDIEAFYDELKEIYHRLSEIKENTESFLTLKK